MSAGGGGEGYVVEALLGRLHFPSCEVVLQNVGADLHFISQSVATTGRQMIE